MIAVTRKSGEEVTFPGSDVGAIVLHGAVQITAQTIHFAIAHDVGIHWLSGRGQYLGGVAAPGRVQRRIRQFSALEDPAMRVRLSARVARAKIENQLRYVMRNSRTRVPEERRREILRSMRAELRAIDRCITTASIRGHEGAAARVYFEALPALLDEKQGLMRFDGRNRRPPRDPFNAALSFGYSLLYRDSVAALLTAGLDPAFGFLHEPRSAAWPLALDLMELFRTIVWDVALVASVNRGQWAEEHFTRAGEQCWLSQEGRRQAIGIYEARLRESWRHPVLQYSLSYARTIELEARLLEKEWSGSPGLFARLRMRG